MTALRYEPEGVPPLPGAVTMPVHQTCFPVARYMFGIIMQTWALNPLRMRGCDIVRGSRRVYVRALHLFVELFSPHNSGGGRNTTTIDMETVCTSWPMIEEPALWRDCLYGDIQSEWLAVGTGTLMAEVELTFREYAAPTFFETRTSDPHWLRNLLITIHLHVLHLHERHTFQFKLEEIMVSSAIPGTDALYAILRYAVILAPLYMCRWTCVNFRCGDVDSSDPCDLDAIEKLISAVDDFHHAHMHMPRFTSNWFELSLCADVDLFNDSHIPECDLVDVNCVLYTQWRAAFDPVG